MESIASQTVKFFLYKIVGERDSQERNFENYFRQIKKGDNKLFTHILIIKYFIIVFLSFFQLNIKNKSIKGINNLS